MFYHVRIRPKGAGSDRQDVLLLDKNADWIEEHIAAPRRQGRDIFISGQIYSWDTIDQIHITETGEAAELLIPRLRLSKRFRSAYLGLPDGWAVAHEGREVTEQFITGPPGTGPRADSKEATTYAANRKAIMVIYGHDTQANTAIFDYLRAIGLQPREWGQLIQASGSGSPYIGQVLDRAFQDAQAVVALFTPDEYVTARTAPPGEQNTGRYQARPNVLIEAGMALATHPTRTVIAVLGNQELPSDLAGRHYIRLSHTDAAPLHDLAARLQDAGCDTDTTGTDWLNPARFPDRDHTTQPRQNDRSPDDNPETITRPRDRAQQAAQPPADTDREDTDARQVVVTTEKGLTSEFEDYSSATPSTHLITVSTPNTYPIKQVDGLITWQTNGGLGMTGFGYAGDPPRADDRRTYYTFRASITPHLHHPEPIIRFADLHGNRYYQFRHHTQRFPQNTDWPAAAAAIDQWLRTGPNPD